MDTIGSQEGRQRPVTQPRRPDAFFVALSRAADHSVLWIAASVLLAAGGRQAGNALRVITPLSFVDKDDDIADGRTE